MVAGNASQTAPEAGSVHDAVRLRRPGRESSDEQTASDDVVSLDKSKYADLLRVWWNWGIFAWLRGLLGWCTTKRG